MASPSNRTKQFRGILRSAGGHWVGNGFPVRTLFAYPEQGSAISPFLLLDYAGPKDFPPTGERRGVGEHPHRGFETVTVVYDGEVEHRDSSGGGGKIGPGDVQWMTAAAGVVHEEFHGRDFAARGGRFEVIQLWVNLPAKDKMSPPGYQGILAGTIPVVTLPDGQGTLRIIAGEFDGTRGPARTFTPIDMWDLELNAGKHLTLSVPDGHTALVVVRSGSLRLDGSDDTVASAEAALFAQAGTDIDLDCREDTRALLLAGQPIDEPIAGMGPFVMNTQAEIQQAIVDYQSGRMGHLQ